MEWLIPLVFVVPLAALVVWAARSKHKSWEYTRSVAEKSVRLTDDEWALLRRNAKWRELVTDGPHHREHSDVKRCLRTGGAYLVKSGETPPTRADWDAITRHPFGFGGSIPAVQAERCQSCRGHGELIAAHTYADAQRAVRVVGRELEFVVSPMCPKGIVHVVRCFDCRGVAQ